MANFFKTLFGGKSQQIGQDNQQTTDQKNFEILKYDGLRAQRTGRIAYAVKCFTEALALEEDFETMGYLSQIYTQTGELEKARQLLQRLTEMEPHMVNTFLSLAQVCFMQEDYTAMEEAAQKAIALDNENTTAYYLLAKARKAQNDAIMSIAHLTKAIALKEDFIEARLLRADVLIDLKHYKEATEDVEAVLKVLPDEEVALIHQGQIAEATGEEAKAEEHYRRVTDVNPFNEQAYLHLGELYIKQRKLTEAIDLFNEAIELNPNFAQAYHERGRAKLLNGDKEGSIADMKMSLELNPNEGSALNGEFNNQQGASTNVLGL